MKVLKDWALGCSLLLSPVMAQVPLEDLMIPNDAAAVLQQKKEVFYRFISGNPQVNAQLSKVISFDHGFHGDTIYAYANERSFRHFLRFGIPYQVLPHPASLTNPPMCSDFHQWYHSRAAFGTYPTYQVYVQVMQQYAADYPNICQLYSLGTTPDGHEILALKITDNINVREDEPQFLYTSSMHGDEIAGYPMMLSLIDYLLTGYGTDPKATSLVNSIEIWINPNANPDGTYAGGDNTVSGATRGNANGIDLNRNYPDFVDGPHPDGNAYQAETQIFMGFADTMDFVMGANFHGGAEVVNYPFDTWSSPHADDNWWLRESVRYADTVHVVSPSTYLDDVFAGSPNPGVTNGYDWYEIDGGRQDFMNTFHQCREFTIELSAQKILAQSQLINHWNYNKASLLNYLRESTYGIRGIITDGCTGNPMRAKVFVNTHDYDSSHVYSSLPVGNYHRPIMPGTYSVTYSAPGYQSQTITGIVVNDFSPTVVNVTLQPLAPVAGFAATEMACSGQVDFTNGSQSATAVMWYFGDGTTSSALNPSHTYANPGTYDVALAISNCAGSDSVMVTAAVSPDFAETPVSANANQSSCGAQSFTFNATAAGSVTWYDAAIGGNAVGSGTSFTTPVLSSTTSYFAESVLVNTPVYVQPSDNTIGAGSYYSAGTTHYLSFDAATDFTLVSVLVYANGAANRTFQLRDAGGAVLQTATVNVPNGASRVSLNFAVAGGSSYQLAVTGGSNLYRNSAGAVYPYEIPGVVSITGASAAGGYYYFCYDWEVQTTCISDRLEVQAVIGAGGGSVSATASGPAAVCVGDVASFNVTVTNSSSHTYNWIVNGNPTGQTGPSFTSGNLQDGDVVECEVISSDACLTDLVDTTTAITLNVFQLPVVDLDPSFFTGICSVDMPFALNMGTPAGGTYTVNGSAATSFDPQAGAGMYAVEYTYVDGNGCANSDLVNVQVLNCTGIAETAQGTMTIYPNPATTEITVELSGFEGGLLVVYNAIGERVARIIVKRGEERVTVNLTDLPSGIYLVQAGSRTARFVKR